MIQRFDLATDEPKPQKLHLAPNCVNSHGRDFFSPAKAWPESSCRKTNCESEAGISAPGEVRTKIACSHMPACHWPFICINSRDLWAAQISARCSSSQVSQPSSAQDTSCCLQPLLLSPSRGSRGDGGRWGHGTAFSPLGTSSASGEIHHWLGKDHTEVWLPQLSDVEKTEWRSWQSAFGLTLFYRAQ